MADVFLDGMYVGRTDRPKELVRKIREARRRGEVSNLINVAYHERLDAVSISTDGGRVRRPLIVVEDGKPKLTQEHIEKLKKGELKFSDLIKMGIIEYLDAEEEENAYIALTPDELTPEHTHLELDPSLIFGFSGSLIPYPEFNRGDRINFGAKMIGQAIGMFLLSHPNRVDTKSNILIYPQVPLVQTYTYDAIPFDKHAGGCNVVVAVACYDGYNMEDAIVVNASSIQRGLFWSYMFRTYEAEEKRYMGGQEDIIGIPQPGVRGYAGEDAYKHLPEDGIVNPETEIESGGVVIGRTSPLRFLGTMDRFIAGIENIRETSVRLRHRDRGIADKVYITETLNGTKLVKVKVRDLKIPEIGDKFATRHGQKGVIGLIVPQEDMPFTESGIVPDLIFNPHGIPSRQTVGTLLELLAGKVGALKGEIIKSPAFSPTSEEDLRKWLEELGFEYSGVETMYNGKTGERFKVKIFIGCCYYQKLDHLVSNKIHARSRGPVTLLTKQPTEGRSKEGGLRFGEMEKDCLIAHGSVLALKERFDSDKAMIPFCTQCGLIAIEDRVRGRKYCQVCGESKIVYVEMAYAFKLLLQELMSMMIYPKVVIKEDGSGIERIEFSILSPEMVKKMSTAKIKRTELYDQEGYPLEGGLMDPRLGVIDPGIRCRTCGGRIGECQGHFGYIELVKPVIHVHYSKFITDLLKVFCRKCGRLLLPEKTLKEAKRLRLKEVLKVVKQKCPHCGAQQKKIKLIKPYTIVEGSAPLTPVEVRERLERVDGKDLELLGYKGFRPEWLVITLLPVPPVSVRPSITLETGERSEDDLTHKLVDVVRINERLRENLELGAPDFIIQDLWELLQYHVATYFDNELSGVPPARHRSGRPLKTLSQRLKTKEGRFRGNLAGKRVNFSARSVVSPDSMIDIDEVGVPEEIARELTIPEMVTERNVERLRRMILNGPDTWPGANYVVRPDGRRKRITEANKEEVAREIAYGWVVERHLLNGDVALFNRQPSLHRMSVMAHRIRVMPFKTLRLHLATCPPYNADFDGDEMNLHIPQTEEARAEAVELMMVPRHIRSPRFSGPIIGIKQDFVTGLYLLTKYEEKIPRREFVQLIRAVDRNVRIPEKSSMSGREIFSLFLPEGFSVEFKTKLGDKVVIKDGKLVEGYVDKVAVASESGKMIDKMELIYGQEFVKEFLFKVAKLALEYLMMRGFSISPTDQDLPPKAKREIEEIVESAKRDVDKLIRKFEAGELKVLVGRTPRETLETMIKRRLNRVLSEIDEVLTKHLKENDTLVMVRSGARGDIVNIIQTAACVGQEAIMGERIERGYYGRTFPHFKVGDLSIESKGFVKRGFKDGLNAFEFFFDAMNSRESLMDKSLKTRHSGYMERRLVGALQDLKVEYDGTVRDSAGKIIQFTAGCDGLDPSKIERVEGGIDVERIATQLFG